MSIIAKAKELSKFDGKKVKVQGWIYGIRSSGKICFLQFRDGTGKFQIIAASNNLGNDAFEQCKKIQRETSVIIEGTVQKNYKDNAGYELISSNLTIIGDSPDYPITPKEHGPDFLLDRRHLWIRSVKQSAILRIRSSLEFAAVLFLQEEGFTRFDSPILTPTACEGTTDLFEVDFYNTSSYLSQSGQLYSEAGIYSLEKVYTLGPCFRAEKSKTRRHLSEFWGIEPEMAWIDSKENMAFQERFIKNILSYIADHHEKDLQILGRTPDEIRMPDKRFEILLYDDAVKILRNAGFSIEWGTDPGVEEEEYLSNTFDAPFFIYKYPVECRAFYIEPDPQRPEVALSSDCLMHGGFGEIITGGQRASDYGFLVSQIEKHGLSIDDFKWYLDLRKYGSVPHSGFGMGIERMVRWICDIRHIRETIPFPRTLKRLYP